jgi:hypothetical protein
MRNQLSSCLLAVLLSASSGFAQFEGTLAMTVTLVAKDGSEREAGTINLAISKAGLRGEVNIQLGPGQGMDRVVLCKTDTPNLNYLISDETKTYTEVDLRQPTETESPRQAQVKWTVKKLGREKLLGYKTQHVLAKPKTDASQLMELWVAKDFLDFETYRKLQACSGADVSSEGGLTQALKAAGAAGMPLKVVVTTEDGDKVRMEAVKVEKKSLPASTFELPAGYTKSGGGRPWKHR